MSSFKENFERGEKEEMDYDDNAFYYFGLCLLLVILLPATWYVVIEPVFYGEYQIQRNLKNCSCSICTEKIRTRAAKYKFSFINGTFVVKALLLIGFWIMWFQCYDVIKDVKQLKTFIPHELLGVAEDASKGQIKKAYRKLSREKHPDKNPDNPNAVNEFIQITKAYTILTDEKAKENFLKYGNPDGKGAFAVGIALPKFL
jgi:translocation protein SEC63